MTVLSVVKSANCLYKLLKLLSCFVKQNKESIISTSVFVRSLNLIQTGRTVVAKLCLQKDVSLK